MVFAKRVYMGKINTSLVMIPSRQCPSSTLNQFLRLLLRCLAGTVSSEELCRWLCLCPLQ